MDSSGDVRGALPLRYTDAENRTVKTGHLGKLVAKSFRLERPPVPRLPAYQRRAPRCRVSSFVYLAHLRTPRIPNSAPEISVSAPKPLVSGSEQPYIKCVGWQ